MDEGRLSNVDDWSTKWKRQASSRLWRVRTLWPEFRDLHKLFARHLPVQRGLRCLEVGCYPGSYMLYFAEHFGYDVSGIEYVPWCAQATKANLAKEGVEAEVISDDLFSYEPASNADCWDIVVSFGFVEHFENIESVVAQHLRLTRPGGVVAIIVPNHTGLYGEIVKAIDLDTYRIHNLMSCEQLSYAVRACGGEILEEGYFGRFGFSASLLYERAKLLHPLAYFAVRAPLLVSEWAGQILPNSRALSPMCAVIARKPG